MTKKFLSGLCFLFFISTMQVFAASAPISEQEAKEVEKFFNSYITSANNYKDDLIDHYDSNAIIERIVIKPDGTKESVKIPMPRYTKELRLGKRTAKLVNYKNRYINKKYEKISDNEYKIKTKRIPMRDKTGLNAEFTITRTPEGLKISHEAMETTVQKFLNRN